jgi:hypothetical protein
MKDLGLHAVLAIASLLGAGAFAAAASAPAATPSEDKAPGDLRASTGWDISLDVDGKVTRIEPDGRIVAAVSDPLREAIRTWHFVPGMIAGKPAPTDTWLIVDVTLLPKGDDKYSIRIDDARTGAHIATTVPPHLSFSTIIHQKHGTAVVKVDYDAEGRVTNTTPYEGGPHVSPDFMRGVQQALRKWTFRPEVVGGRGLAGSSIVPVCLTVTEGPRPPKTQPVGECDDWKAPGSHDTEVHSGDSFALEPAAKLQSDVIGHTL